MTIQALLPLLSSFFLGGILNEIRWIRRVRGLERQLYLGQLGNPDGSTSIAEVAEGKPSAEGELLSLRSLHDHLAAEATGAPQTAPSPTPMSGRMSL